jgi:hypothetical protein
MDSLDYWRLSDEVSVVQAAILVIGEDPSKNQEYIEGWEAHSRPVGYDAVLSALKNAVRSGAMAATIRNDASVCSYDEYPSNGFDIRERPEGMNVKYRVEPNWHLTVVKVASVKRWLLGRGFRDGFFIHETMEDTTEAFLDSKNPYYAPKLAAAINAWRAITSNPDLLNGKTPKQALEKWLREHASQYGLTKDDGNPNDHGIEEICKIATWNLLGGAAKTPVRVPANPPTPSIKRQKAGVSAQDADSGVPLN